MRACWFAVLSLALPACTVSHQHYRPAERAHAESPRGRPAAEYDLGVQGRRWGEVRVWSSGAHRDGDPPTTRIHVGFELESAVDELLTLDLGELVVEGIEVNGAPVAALRPVEPHPEAAVPGHAVRRVDFVFALPTPVRPDAIGPFRVRWVLRGPDGWSYEQHTGFVADNPPPYGYWGPRPWHYGPAFVWSYGWCY